MKAIIFSWIAEPTARALISLLWWLGDMLFDWAVTSERALQWRDASLRQCEIRDQALDKYEAKTERQKVWKENQRNAIAAVRTYMGFPRYVTLGERAERMVSGGGVHQP